MLLNVPITERVTREISKGLLQSLPQTTGPISFEIIGSSSNISVQFCCQEDDHFILRSQLRAFFPNTVITESDSHLITLWTQRNEFHSIVVDIGLAREFMLPIQRFGSFDVDPLIGVIGALNNLAAGELGVIQILFQPVRNPWAQSITRSVTRLDGKPFFIDAPEIVIGAKEKIADTLFAVVLRVATKAPSRNRALSQAQSIAGALRQFTSTQGNELIPLSNEDYDDRVHDLNLLARTTNRSGMILNSAELVGLVHLPSKSVVSPKLRRKTRKTKTAPERVFGNELILGENAHAGDRKVVSLDAQQRSRHTHVIGASGTGKSHLIQNLIIQDLRAGKGVAVLDPHGDLIDRLLSCIPKNRLEDVILFDPSDTENPIGFNILQAHSSTEKQLLASDLVSVFQRLSTSWGDRMTSVLANAILAFLESSSGGTLSDLS